MYGSKTFAHCCIIIFLALYNRVRIRFSLSFLFLFYILSNKSEIYFVKAFILLKHIQINIKYLCVLYFESLMQYAILESINVSPLNRCNAVSEWIIRWIAH